MQLFGDGRKPETRKCFRPKRVPGCQYSDMFCANVVTKAYFPATESVRHFSTASAKTPFHVTFQKE